MTHYFDITTIAQLDAVIEELRAVFLHGVIYLHGDLGCGKTTFVQRWLYQMGYRGAVSSPTYTLINEYTHQNQIIIHADLYRLAEADELLYLGTDLWQPAQQLIFIEWAERGAGFLPKATVEATFLLSDKRQLIWATN